MATVVPTQADHTNRLQHFMCCLADKGSALAEKLSLGIDCSCDINTLILLNMYWHVLVCYDPTATTICLTQAQIDAIWDDIACKCGICFSPYGSTYTAARTSCGGRIAEDGSKRVTELSDPRVIGCGTATGTTTPNGTSDDNTIIYYA